MSAGASPNVSWIVPPPHYAGGDDDDALDGDDDTDDSEGGIGVHGSDSETELDVTGAGRSGVSSTTGSCIGVRKLCLNDARCKYQLDEFRKYCTENKRLNLCTATDWYGTGFILICFSTV